MRFQKDSTWGIRYTSTEPDRDEALGTWLTFVMGTNTLGCLHALCCAYDARNPENGELVDEAEGIEVVFSAAEVTIVNAHFDDEPSKYSLNEVTEALEEYWKFLVHYPWNPKVVRGYRPDLPKPLADLLLWEELRKRSHPYRGRIEGIPEVGPR